MQEKRADVCVVGNGVLGLAVAWALLQIDPSLKVIVVGPAAREGAASPAAAAMLNSLAELTERSRASSAGEARVSIGRLAAKRWPEYVERLGAALGEKPPRIQPGTTLILNTQSGRGDEGNFEAVRRALIEWGEPHEEIAPGTLSGLDPAPDQRPLRMLHIHKEGSVDSRAVLAALETAGQRTGRVTIRDAWAEGFETDAGGRVTGIRLQGGTTIQAGDTVLAAGAGSQRLLDELGGGDRIPCLLAGRGVAAVLRPRLAAPSHVVRTVRSGGCGLNLVPLASGDFYLGATNEVGLSPRRHASVGAIQGLSCSAKARGELRSMACVDARARHCPLADEEHVVELAPARRYGGEDDLGDRLTPNGPGSPVPGPDHHAGGRQFGDRRPEAHAVPGHAQRQATRQHQAHKPRRHFQQTAQAGAEQQGGPCQQGPDVPGLELVPARPHHQPAAARGHEL